MKWMVEVGSVDRNSAISAVRDEVVRLFPGKDPHSGFCRTLPLIRLLAHHKVVISSHLTETIDAIKRYPYGDNYRAETFARTAHSSSLMHLAEEDSGVFAWASSFWKSNQVIVPCLYE